MAGPRLWKGQFNRQADMDIIKSKTKELENLPGHILGLDGWILRSIPKHLRNQFLTAYEKVLKIVFHPDRYPDDSVKRTSREKYLQAVSDAVTYMSSDELTYDVASESVPTKKNPMVSLQNSIDTRDNIISNLDEKLEDRAAKVCQLQDELGRIKSQMIKAKKSQSARDAVHTYLRGIVNRISRMHPVPVRIEHCQIRGMFLDLRESELLHQITKYASGAFLNPDHEWLTLGSWVDLAKAAKVASNSFDTAFHKGHASIVVKGNRLEYMIVAAFSIAHLCAWVRHVSGYNENLTDEITLKMLTDFLAWKKNSSETIEFKTQLSMFSIPFFGSGAILLVREKEPSGIPVRFIFRFRLIIVDEVDAQQLPDKALLDGKNREIEAKNRKIAKLEKKIRDLKTDLAESKH